MDPATPATRLARELNSALESLNLDELLGNLVPSTPALMRNLYGSTFQTPKPRKDVPSTLRKASSSRLTTIAELDFELSPDPTPAANNVRHRPNAAQTSNSTARKAVASWAAENEARINGKATNHQGQQQQQQQPARLSGVNIASQLQQSSAPTTPAKGASAQFVSAQFQSVVDGAPVNEAAKPSVATIVVSGSPRAGTLPSGNTESSGSAVNVQLSPSRAQ